MRPSPPLHLLGPLLLLGCSDYGVIGERAAPPTEPELLAEPALLDLRSCGASRHTVTLASTGTAAVSLTDVWVEGSGWALVTVEWPETLSPGDTLALTVEALPDGTGGEAILLVEHRTGALTVPLAVTADRPPVATISTPVDGAVLAPGVALELSGGVQDDEDPAAALVVTWESDLDGPVAEPVPGDDGGVAHSWPASARTSGTHTLTLSATDSCGQTATETVSICQEEGDSVDGPMLATEAVQTACP